MNNLNNNFIFLNIKKAQKKQDQLQQKSLVNTLNEMTLNENQAAAAASESDAVNASISTTADTAHLVNNSMSAIDTSHNQNMSNIDLSNENAQATGNQDDDDSNDEDGKTIKKKKEFYKN